MDIEPSSNNVLRVNIWTNGYCKLTYAEFYIIIIDTTAINQSNKYFIDYGVFEGKNNIQTSSAKI